MYPWIFFDCFGQNYFHHQNNKFNKEMMRMVHVMLFGDFLSVLKGFLQLFVKCKTLKLRRLVHSKYICRTLHQDELRTVPILHSWCIDRYLAVHVTQYCLKIYNAMSYKRYKCILRITAILFIVYFCYTFITASLYESKIIE